MIQFLRLVKGYVHFSAEGGFPERFINLCKINGISLWDVKNDGEKVVAFTTAAEFEALNIPAERSGMVINTIKTYGLKNFALRHKWRCGVALGVLLSFLFWVYMSAYIWEVEILDCGAVNVESFTESLAALGVKVGGRKSDIDIKEVQKQLMNEYKQLLWVSVNIFGGKVQVEMSRVVEQKEITDTKIPVNLVAAKDGEIVLVKGYSGVNVVENGDNVSAGTLLVSGVVKNSDGSEYFTHAQGQVLARTKNVEKIELSSCGKKMVSENPQSRYCFYIFSLKIPVWKKTKGEFITESESFLQSGDTVLPFGIIREDNFETKDTMVKYSADQARSSALIDAVKLKRKKYNDTELERVEYFLEEKEDCVVVGVEIDCIEDIAQESIIATLE